MVSESVRRAILSNPGISESEKSQYRSSSGGGSSGGSSSSTTTKKSLGGSLTGIYVNGKLTGVEDSLLGISRPPSAQESLFFGSLSSSGSSGGTSSSPLSLSGSKTSSKSSSSLQPTRVKKYISSPSEIKRKLSVGTRKTFETIPLSAIGQLQARREKLRNEQSEIIKVMKKPGPKKPQDIIRLTQIQKELATLTAAQKGVEVVTIPAGLLQLIKNPKEIKNIPGALKEEGVRIVKLARVSPTEAVVEIGGELLLLKGTGKTFKVAGKIPKKTAAKLTGKLAKVEKSTIVIGKKAGKEGLELKIAKPGLKKLETSLKEQAALSGREIPVVTSAQADELVTLFKTKKVVRKPIPNEKLLKSSTKKLLKKFDAGKITKKELIKLDKTIKVETKGAGSLLERSFFVDPKGRVRLSRLGIQKEAGLKDILRGNFTLKTQKPQILVFRDIKVQSFPKTPIFNQIKKRLAANKRLTQKQSNALLKFQLKKSGKFKPVGALTKEPELTAAPGELIKKVKTLGYVEIDGQLVPIVQSKIVKASKRTKSLLKKAKAGKITKKELKELEKRLKKETGFKKSDIVKKTKKEIKRSKARKPGKKIKRTKTKITRRRTKSKPRLSVKRKLGALASRGIKVKRKIKTRKVIRKPARRKPRTPQRKKPVRPSGRKPTRRGGTTTTTTGGGSRPKTVKKTIRPVRVGRIARRKSPQRKKQRLLKSSPKRIKRVKKKKEIKAYNVYARPLKKKGQKKQPKLVKVNRKPLTKKRAEDLRNYVLDTSLARTGSIRPTKGKVGKSKLKVPVGYAARTKKKFRSFRRVKGKKKSITTGKIIEKRKNILDTRAEKNKITLRKRIAMINRPVKRKKVRISKPIKRRKTSKSRSRK